MRRPQGYAIWTDPIRPGLRATVEADTFTCHHCNSVVFVPPRADPSSLGGFCRLCMRHICGPCTDKACTPFEKKLEEMERKYYTRRQYEKVMGL
jgi:hypothetical protein